MNNLLRATALAAALPLAGAGLTVAAQSASAVTFPGSPKAAVTAPHPVNAPGLVPLTVHTSACVKLVQVAAEPSGRPGTHVLSTVAAGSGKAFRVTVKLPAGRWTVYYVTARVCSAMTGGIALLPAKGGVFAVINVARPAPPATLPGTGKQEG